MHKLSGMDLRNLHADKARLAVSLGVGVAVIAMLAMGLILLPVAPHLPGVEKNIELPLKKKSPSKDH